MAVNIKMAIEFLNINGWDIIEYEGKYYSGDTEDTELSPRRIEQIYNSYKEDRPGRKDKSKPKNKRVKREQFRSLRYEIDSEDE